MLKKGHSRRDFLKIVGATTGIAATGCSQELPEKLIPYVIQPDEVIPGVAAYYSGACGECSSGCGVVVKTREGRAIKVEGNSEHPVNKGALCGLGQSTLQTLYDPDRVRQPLKRDVSGSFQPISWEQAIEEISSAVKNAGNKKTYVVSKPVSGSSKTLLDSFKSTVAGFDYLPFETLNNDEVQLAAEKSFGEGFRVNYDFSKADVVVGVGADYLGTWGSIVENSQGWAKRRSPDKSINQLSAVYHVEPRFSLTASNADKWLKNAPGTEAKILLALLKLVVDHGGVKGFRGSEESSVRALIGKQSVDSLLADTGVERKSLVEIAKRLVLAKNSLVVAGGPAVSASGEVVPAIANLLNVALGNIGKTVVVSRSDAGAFQSSYSAVSSLVKELADKKVGVVIFSQVNPAYSLPSKLDFDKACAHADLVVSLATNLDETSRLAHIVLPASTSYESWNDTQPRNGVYNLNQPAMQPLYETQSLGDTLISLAAKLGVDIGKSTSFHEYIKEQWKIRLGEANFAMKWVEAVERGGSWTSSERQSIIPTLTSKAFEIEAPNASSSLTLITFPTAMLGDGAGGNRAWMQEIPDPITTAVWGSWIELHPDTAAKHGIADKQVVRVEAEQRSVEAPVYITKRIHPNVVAVPMGRGHTSLGRYADGVGVNPASLLPASSVDSVTPFVQAKVRISRSYAREQLIVTQMQDEQGNRGILRSVTAGKLSKKLKDAHHGHGEHHGHGGHHDPLALGPQEAPKQMYKQMEHVEYRWGMSIDLNSCTGCNACVVACYAENNVPIVGRELCREGREMAWIRIDRYFNDEDPNQPNEGHMPMLCQHCNNAPCEPVCPVYATYHNDEGLNMMAYNRCVGTRYCSNNCSYKVRRFNWFTYQWPEPLNWQLNPDVSVREVGIMEKCSFCVQRIKSATNRAKDLGRPVPDGEIKTACQQTCPTGAIKFGNLKDDHSEVSKAQQSPRAYKALDGHLNTQPALSYLAKIKQESI